jgi:hypothetical protein
MSFAVIFHLLGWFQRICVSVEIHSAGASFGGEVDDFCILRPAMAEAPCQPLSDKGRAISVQRQYWRGFAGCRPSIKIPFLKLKTAMEN